MEREFKRQYRFDPDKAARLLFTLANPVRLEIVKCISLREWDVNSLCDEIGLSQSATSSTSPN
ncbi:ArsR/SmtB family transcription factor [Agrobacterium rosae]